jgi:hypothetical protein
LLADLQRAYIRRKQWEARLQAAELLKVLSQALSGDDKTMDVPRISSTGRMYHHVSSDALLSQMGAQLN